LIIIIIYILGTADRMLQENSLFKNLVFRSFQSVVPWVSCPTNIMPVDHTLRKQTVW